MKKQACWRGKWVDQQTIRWSLWNLATKREITDFYAQVDWHNVRAEEAAAFYTAAIEQKAKSQGYELVENPWD